MKKFGDGLETQKVESVDENIDVALLIFIFFLTYMITYDEDTKKLFQ